MNKLDFTPTGGWPLHIDDLKFMYDALYDGFKAFVLTFSAGDSNPVILQGCEITTVSSNWNVAPGYIGLENEIFYFPGQTVPLPTSNNKPFWRINEVVDPNGGSKVFKNLSSHDVRFFRTANLIMSSVGNYELKDTKRISYYLRELVKSQQASWTTILEGSGSGYSVSQPIKYIIDIDLFLHQKGVISLQNGGVNRLIYQIPGVVLTEEQEYYIGCKIQGDYSHTAVKVGTDGSVYLVNDSRDVELLISQIPAIRLQ